MSVRRGDCTAAGSTCRGPFLFQTPSPARKGFGEETASTKGGTAAGIAQQRSEIWQGRKVPQRF